MNEQQRRSYWNQWIDAYKVVAGIGRQIHERGTPESASEAERARMAHIIQMTRANRQRFEADIRAGRATQVRQRIAVQRTIAGQARETLRSMNRSWVDQVQRYATEWATTARRTVTTELDNLREGVTSVVNSSIRPMVTFLIAAAVFAAWYEGSRGRA